MQYFNVQTKKDTKTYTYLAHGIPATSSETTNPEFFARKFVGLHFFRKKLQIVFLCKLNSYTYLVYFDSRKKIVFDQIEANIKKISTKIVSNGSLLTIRFWKQIISCRPKNRKNPFSFNGTKYFELQRLLLYARLQFFSVSDK